VKKTLTLLAVLVLAAFAVQAQMNPVPLKLEIANAKIITCHIATSGTADITIPLFTAPCAGYIVAPPRWCSTSGSAAADTSSTLNWQFFFLKKDSAATAASDTMAKYTLISSTGVYTMTALKNYNFSWLTATNKAKQLAYKNVLQLRCEATGTTPTAITNIEITFIFVPTTSNERFK